MAYWKCLAVHKIVSECRCWRINLITHCTVQTVEQKRRILLCARYKLKLLLEVLLLSDDVFHYWASTQRDHFYFCFIGLFI